MDKVKLNYWVDVGLIISFFVSFITGLIKWPGLIRIMGVAAYKILYFDNISRWHDWSGLIMGLLVLFHLVLHWDWIVSVTRNIFIKSD